MIAVLTVEYFNKPEEIFLIDVDKYKNYKKFLHAYDSFVNKCNHDGMGTDLIFISDCFKIHNYGNPTVAISIKEISKIYYELISQEELDSIYNEEDKPKEPQPEPKNHLSSIDENIEHLVNILNTKKKQTTKRNNSWM